MLKPNQFVQTKWNSSNKRKYIDLGYKFTKINDYVTVKAEDLLSSSKIKVIVICDYCGCEFEQPKCDYTRSLELPSHKNCCKKCAPLQVKENNIIKYGVENTAQLQSTKDKIARTNIKKYGCSCAMQNPKIMEKTKRTNLKKYGSEWYFSSEEAKELLKTIDRDYDSALEKRKATCLEKYGVQFVTSLDSTKEKIRDTNIKKYGVPFVMMNPKIKEKSIQTLIESQHNRISKQEQKCYEKLCNIFGKENLEHSVRCSKYTLDFVLNINDCKINIEYDGWYWHKDIQEHDKERNEYVMSQGYKIIRILTNGRMPEKEDLIQAVDKLKDNKENIIVLSYI